MLAWSDLRDACGGRKLILTAARGSSFWGLQDLFVESGVVCTDDSPEFDGTGVRFLSHERLTGRRWDWGADATLLLEEAWQKADGAFPGEGWTVIAPEGCPSARSWAARTGSEVRRRKRSEFDFTDKRTLLSLVERLGLPGVGGEWVAMGVGQRLGEWAGRFGTPLVVQATHGQGGSGTVFVRSESDWARAVALIGGGSAWIAPYVGSLSVNINALAVEQGARAGCPSVQLTGYDFLNTGEGGYCGNDFAAAALLPGRLLEEVREQTERIGEAMAGMGFRGLYGLDFVVDERDGRPKAVDLNPRMQGSTALSVQAERCGGRTPLAAVAVLLEAGFLEAEEAVRPGDDFFHCAGGAQVRFRTAAEVRRWAGGLLPGVYTREGSRRRAGWMVEEIGEDEVLVTGGPPREGTWVDRGSQLFRIYSRGGMVEGGSFVVGEWVRRLAEGFGF